METLGGALPESVLIDPSINPGRNPHMHHHHQRSRTTGRPGRAGAFALIAVMALPELSAQLTPDAFQALGDLPGGFISTTAHGISADGSTIIGESESAIGPEAFRWTPDTGIVALGVLTGTTGFSTALDVSDDGSVIVGQSSGSLIFGDGFVWTAATGMQSIGAPAGALGSWGNAVSGDGSFVAGYYYDASFQSQAFRWSSGGGFEAIHAFAGAGTTSAARAITPDGIVVGGEGSTPATGGASQAIVWMNNSGIELGTLATAGGGSGLFDLSDDGSVAVGWTESDLGVAAFRWDVDTGMSSLGNLPGGMEFNLANAVSADGSVVVGRAAGPDDDEAFIWTAVGGMVSLSQFLANEGLDLTGWQLLEAVGISADGLVIVGNGINPAGDNEAWLVNLRTTSEDNTGGDEEEDDDTNPPETCDQDQDPCGHNCRDFWRHHAGKGRSQFAHRNHHCKRRARGNDRVFAHHEDNRRRRRKSAARGRDNRRRHC